MDSLFNTLVLDWEQALATSSQIEEAVTAGWQDKHLQLEQEWIRVRESGPHYQGASDLLSVIHRARRETYHCLVIAWLLRPNAPHGLGSAFLAELTRALYDAETVGPVRVETEVWKPGLSTGGRQADIVIWTPERCIVIEAKVDAPESRNQCLDTYHLWAQEPGVEFVFLTPSGHSPKQAGDEAERFHLLSFSDIAHMLERALARPDTDIQAPARTAAYAYLQTLHVEFKETTRMTQVDPKLAFFLKNQETIEEWYQLRNDASRLAAQFLRDLEQPLRSVADELGVEFIKLTAGGYPKYLLANKRWLSPGPNKCRVGIGIEWPKSRVTFTTAYTGVWVNCDDPHHAPLHGSILQELQSRNEPKESRSKWWPVWSYTQPEGEYWLDLDATAHDYCELLRRRWLQLSPVVAAAIQADSAHCSPGSS